VRGLRVALALLAVAAVVSLEGSAYAHMMGLSRSDLTPEGSAIHARIVIRADEAANAVSGLDGNGDGVLSDAELSRARPALQAAFVDALQIESDGSRCRGALEDVAPDPPDGLRLDVAYACSGPPPKLHVHFGFLERLASGHRHVATFHLPKGDVFVLAVLQQTDFDVDVGSPPSRGFVSFVRAGVEHILWGADHLAFLLGLVLGGRVARGRAAALVAVLTAFTVGHSVSLAIATLGGFAPGPRLVEPAVALSVAYVGAENVLVSVPRRRWLLTLPFGFVHGFALAGGLIPLGLPRGDLPAALLGFNLGVEAGQLVVLALLLPPLAWLAGRSVYPRAARVASGGIALAGIVWFVARVCSH
jgi:hypothetical protein